MAKSILAPPEPDPPQGSSSGPQWYVYNKCRLMPHPLENVCCKNKICVSTTAVFRQVVLDPHILAMCIVSRSTIYADSPDYRASSYRWVVWEIRGKYPALDYVLLKHQLPKASEEEQWSQWK